MEVGYTRAWMWFCSCSLPNRTRIFLDAKQLPGCSINFVKKKRIDHELVAQAVLLTRVQIYSAMLFIWVQYSRRSKADRRVVSRFRGPWKKLIRYQRWLCDRFWVFALHDRFHGSRFNQYCYQGGRTTRVKALYSEVIKIITAQECDRFWSGKCPQKRVNNPQDNKQMKTGWTVPWTLRSKNLEIPK